jgi:large subunit ribosomal protein L35
MKNKIKTKKAAAKRFKITGTGKVLRGSVGKRHLLEHKAKKTKRQKRNTHELTSADKDKVKAMLPGLK